MEEQKHYLSYAAEEIDRRLKKVDDIPTMTSELINNSGFITKDDIPEVPTRVSAFENDALYLKEGDIDLTPYAKKSEIEETYQQKGDYATKEEVNSKQDKLIEGEGISIEGNVISCVHDKTLYKVVTELPEVGEEHKIYLIVSTEQEENNLYNEWAYINGAWEMLGTYKATIDLEPYALKEDVPTKVSELENDLQYITVNEIPESETYVLNFTIKDGINTGEYDAEEYAKLRAAIEAGKLIIIGGAVTRVTADSQAMAADYVVIRYGTPRISDDNTSVTMSIYELKFSATEYSSKAVHKVIK